LLSAGLERIKGLPVATMALNTPLPCLWPSTYWLFADQHIWTERHPDLWPEYEGTILTCTNVPAKHVMDFKALRGYGFSREPFDGLFLGRSCSYIALQFGIGLGFERVYFFGLDMRPTDGYCWYGPSPEPNNLPHQRAAKFSIEAKWWDDAVANHLTAEELSRVVLCGLADWPFTKHFRKLAPADGVEELLHEHSSVEPEGN
jgi:hypothetical protein